MNHAASSRSCLRFTFTLHRVLPQLRPLVGGKREGIVEAWNAVLQGVPSLRHWTVEELMASASKVEGVDLGWRNYLRERYDV